MIENTNNISMSSFRTYYRYDEAGNRINKKQYLYVNGSPPGGEGGPGGGDSIIVDEGDGQGYWAMQSNTFYVRDASSKEIALYSSVNIEQWNAYRLDNVGAVKSNGDKQFYLKDHLGCF